MRWRRPVLGLVLLLSLALYATAPARGAEASELDALIREAGQYEARGEWRRASEIYEKALRARPDSPLLRQKLWECRVHHEISLRVRDQSYHQTLLRLPRSRILAFLSEVLTLIQDSYFRPPDLVALEQAGFQSLLVAYDDPLFRATHLAHLNDTQLEQLKTLTWGYTQKAKEGKGRITDIVCAALQFAQEANRLTSVPDSVFLIQYTFGLATSLDKYTGCLTPQRLKDVYALIDGEFVGIGVELRHNDRKELEIVHVLPNSPAEAAGLQSRDVILAIDGIPVEGETLDESADRLQGPLGSEVTLLIRRQGKPSPLRVTLRRDHVEVPSVEEAVILSPAEGIGYVRISSFQRTTFRELASALERLQAEGMQVLILDLRGNPGGLLTAAVDVADLFLSSGVIVSTSGRGNGQSWTYWARPTSTISTPLVLLVDRDSASASEIVAGALKDHHRALIVGERTYGKGTVQSILPLKTVEAGIRLTTAEFLSPTGRPYAHVGVEPDIAVERAPGDFDPEDDFDRTDLSAALRLSRDAQLRAALRHARKLVAAQLHAAAPGDSVP